jgi:predicted ABC-type exoprotein transport system permease subunit
MFKILYVCSLKADPYRDQRFIEEFRQFPDVELIVCKGSALMNIYKLKKLLPEADAVITMYGNKQVKTFMEAQTVKSFNKVEPSFIANNK